MLVLGSWKLPSTLLSRLDLLTVFASTLKVMRGKKPVALAPHAFSRLSLPRSLLPESVSTRIKAISVGSTRTARSWWGKSRPLYLLAR